MGFSLKEIRSGAPELFDIQVLLELLGDPINDEIELGENRYRITSFQEIGSESSVGTPHTPHSWVSFAIGIPNVGASIFSLEGRLIDVSNLFLSLNNVLYKYGQDFSIESGNLHWQGQFELEPSDSLLLRYQIIA